MHKEKLTKTVVLFVEFVLNDIAAKPAFGYYSEWQLNR